MNNKIALLNTDNTSTRGTVGVNSGRAADNPNGLISKNPTPIVAVRIPGETERVDYDKHSAYLRRELNVALYNSSGSSISFKQAKVNVSGSKFIGIQQDNFTITLNNINYALLASALTKGYRYVRVFIEQPNQLPDRIFTGEIRMVNVGKSSAIEREVEFVCLTRASDLMANMVVPLTIHSSINAWSVWDALQELKNVTWYQYGEVINIESEVEALLKDIKVPSDYSYSAQKSPINIIEDLISLANEHVDPSSPARWFDYKLTSTDDFGSGGVINIFSQATGGLEVIEISPETGLLDAPTISDLEISFNHIYNPLIVPGRIIKLDNSWVSTMGADSAFIWAWDPNHMYVVTEVRYSFATYPNRFTASARVRSYSKYRNFTSTNKIYKEN